MKIGIIFCLFFLALNASAYCGQVNRIELSDGSIINGEILSYADGIYVVSTAAFGAIKLEAAKVSKIELVNSPLSGAPISPTNRPGNLSQPQIDAYREKLMGNPENAAIITGLAADQQIQGLAQDPQVLEAVKSGDIQALMKNEKFMGIVNNPKVQEAVKKLKQEEQSN